MVLEFLVIVNNLETLWSQFRVEDDVVLEYLIALKKDGEYTPDLAAKDRTLTSTSKATAAKLVS